jgi:hypothetical protein
MSEIDVLIQNYEQFARVPWDQTLAGPQKVWFVMYDPANERRVRLHIQDFETATRQAKHGWHLVDITDSFAQWMAKHEYRDEYFSHPEDMDLALQDFQTYLVELLTSELTADDVDTNTVVAICGVGSLFKLISVSELLDSISEKISGRLLVFFPGTREGNNIRLLDAKDGWNYLAVTITANEGK